VILVLAPALVAATKARPLVSLFYYVASDPASPEILRQNAKRISIIAPQTFSMDAEGFVMGEVPADVKAIAREHRLAIMPLVTNRRFDQPTMHAVLDDPARQERLIRYLLYYAKRDGAMGFQFDFENISHTYRDKFTELVRRTARAFHRRGLKLTVAVVGRSTGTRDPARAGGWDNWSGVYDYKKLGQYADFLSIMAYPEHAGFSPPGPVASLPWIEKIIEYTLSEVPRSRISLGLPVYHVHWWRSGDDQKWQARGRPFRDVAGFFSKDGVQNRWDESACSGTLEFKENGTSHTVWYEDARSLKAKLALLDKYRLPGFSAWRLGQEDPATWDLLTRVRRVK